MGTTKFQWHIDSDIRDHKKVALAALEVAKEQEKGKTFIKVPIMNGYILRKQKD